VTPSLLPLSLFPYVAETRGFVVRVSVSYLVDQSEPLRQRWFWAYHIRIENESDMTAQLLTRHWEITDGRGAVNIVDGDGVIGEQPMIAPGGSYDYVSGCPLGTTKGFMVGSYRMIGEDGSMFDIAIPRFDLHAPVVRG
jgi:ApaG protein